MNRATWKSVFALAGIVLCCPTGPVAAQFFPNGPLVPPYPIPVPVYVRVLGPEGSNVVFYGEGGKPHRLPMPTTVGLKVLNTYYFCLESLRGFEGRQFYGTIETIGAPNAPPQIKISSVPIPIRINDEDLYLLAREQVITKFIVLEDPDLAMPIETEVDEPIVYDASDAKDPLKRAKEIGLLMLVVRIGNRIPTPEELSGVTGRSIYIARNLPIKDAAGKERQAEEYFVDIETGATAPIVPVAHIRKQFASHPGMNRQGQTAMAPRNGRPSCPPGQKCPPGQGPSASFGRPDVTFGPGAPQMMPLPILSGNFGSDDQFLCDGGDDGRQAGIAPDGVLVNVDPSDTVIQFRDGVGKVKIIPSNCVCVFAPRFAEVRHTLGISGFDAQEFAANVIRDRSPAGVIQSAKEWEKDKYIRLAAVKTRQRPTVVASEQWTGEFTEVRVLAALESAIGWAQMIGLIGIAEFRNSEQPYIARRVQFAKTLTQVQSPQIVAMVQGAGQLVTVWRHQEIRKIEEIPGFTCLEIEKCASVSEAKPGDTVEFLIRYKNVGDMDATSVAITDNLVPRLEYVKESAKSDRKATFIAQENEVGSHILRWELHDPLKPNETGSVTFKTIVR